MSDVRSQSGACLNCGATLAGTFCSACGQRDVPPYPSVRELAVDAFWELSGWDGRFASTVRALVARPGKLTCEFLKGRRARYISPLRLYLMCSLVYFLGAVTAPNVTRESGKSLFVGLRVTPTITDGAVPSRPERVGNAVGDGFRSLKPVTEAQRAALLDDIKRAPSFMQPFLQRSATDPLGLRRSILEAMPRMLFVLLPVFAAIVALFYHGRKYPEHLYFAIHLHAFAFLALALIQLAKFTQLPAIVVLASILSFLSIPVYATIAFRHAYGGSVIGTVTKEVGIGAIYFVTSIAAFATMIYIVSVFG